MPDERDSFPFTADDFRKLVRQSMLPTGVRGRYPIDPVAEHDARKLLGIMDSMTSDERLAPGQIADLGRRRRIAGGAGVTLKEVEELVTQLDALSQTMQSIRRLEDG